MVNLLMMATANLQEDDFKINTKNHLFLSFLVSSNPLKRRSLYVSQALQQRISRYISCICWCCCNVPTYKWKCHNGTIEIIKVIYIYNSLGQDMKITQQYLCYPLSVSQMSTQIYVSMSQTISGPFFIHDLSPGLYNQSNTMGATS